MKQEFSSWLKSDKGFTPDSAKDVASRLRRAQALCPIDWNSPVAENLVALGQVNAFVSLTVSVRSQLRRAVRLHAEYLQLHRKIRR